MNASTKLAIFILVVVVIFGEITKEPGVDSPRPRIVKPGEKTLPPLPDVRAEGRGDLRPASPRDPIIQIEAEEKGDRQQYTGTAFSIDRRGLWITARHVTEGCDKLALLRPHRRAMRVTGLAQHPRADVSILRTDSGYNGFPVDYSIPEYDQEGFHFGFPRGEPGAVYSKLIGRRTIKTTGSRSYREPVLAWAEKIRIPNSDESLGGISGGPILNKQGHVVGIHVAGSVRRGRSFSSLPSTIETLLNDNNVKFEAARMTPANTAELTPDEFAKVGEDLRGDLSVAQVICRTD